MAKRIINLAVNDEYIVGAGVVIGAAGSHNDVVLEVTFNEKWVGLNIIATFRDALGENPVAVELSAVSTLDSEMSNAEQVVHRFSVPLNVKKYEGKITLSFTGYTVAAVASEDGGTAYQEALVINSGTAYFNVLHSDVQLASDLFRDANVGEQLHQDVETLGDMYGNMYDALEAIIDIQDNLSETMVVAFEKDEAGGESGEGGEGVDPMVFELLKKVYPVGSIYMSMNSRSPGEFLGGVWEQIPSKFLIGTDKLQTEGETEPDTNPTYRGASTGGEAEHSHESGTLTAHIGLGENWSVWYAQSSTYADTNWSASYQMGIPGEASGAARAGGVAVGGKTDSTSNLPPYIAVYMWKRTK